MTTGGFGYAPVTSADRDNAQAILRQARDEGRLSQADYDNRSAQLPLMQSPDQLAALIADLKAPSWGSPSAAQTQGYQGQAYQGQASQGQAYQGEPYPGQGYQAPAAGQVYQGQAYAPGQPYQPGQVAPRRTNQLALASLICGIAQIFFGLLTGIPAVICGHLARKQIRQTGEEGAGMAMAGLILGYVGIVLSVILIVVIIAVIAFAVHHANTTNLNPNSIIAP
jgi:hypothetical protein